jgi:hypothetical protein
MSGPMIQDGIDAVRERPRVFLKNDSVRELSIFLTGYCFGLDMACPSGFPHGNELVAFRHWLANRLRGGPNDELETLLLSASDNDDAEAFQRFFVFWEEFLRGGSS